LTRSAFANSLGSHRPRIIRGVMEIDRYVLTQLLEAFVDYATVLQRELMLYQLLFQGACQAEGLTPQQIEKALERARQTQGPKIREATHAMYKDLLAKVPSIIDLLADDQTKALTFLKEWMPKGPPN
jgi:hypothetical protein